MLHKSTPASANNPVNINHRQILLIGTDHFNSTLSKVIRFEKKQSVFKFFRKYARESKKKTISGIFFTFKIKSQIIHVATYISFFADSNNSFYI